MIKSFIIAFSTYSRIPMPKVLWNDKSMKYSMCFFPFVGTVIGCMELACLYLLLRLDFGALCIAAILTALPLLITGGIHMDGFMDTVDAGSSYKDMDEKLKILKDPHIGAFAVIYAIVYIVIYFGLMCELVGGIELEGSRLLHNSSFVVYAIGHALSRALSGLSVVSMRKAKKDGMVAGTAKASDKKVKYIMAIWVVLIVIILVLTDWQRGAATAFAGIAAYLYYWRMAYKNFGGITGDLAGFFLQLCELMILFVCTVHL